MPVIDAQNLLDVLAEIKGAFARASRSPAIDEALNCAIALANRQDEWGIKAREGTALCTYFRGHSDNPFRVARAVYRGVGAIAQYVETAADFPAGSMASSQVIADETIEVEQRFWALGIEVCAKQTTRSVAYGLSLFERNKNAASYASFAFHASMGFASPEMIETADGNLDAARSFDLRGGHPVWRNRRWRPAVRLRVDSLGARQTPDVFRQRAHILNVWRNQSLLINSQDGLDSILAAAFCAA